MAAEGARRSVVSRRTFGQTFFSARPSTEQIFSTTWTMVASGRGGARVAPGRARAGEEAATGTWTYHNVVRGDSSMSLSVLNSYKQKRA